MRRRVVPVLLGAAIGLGSVVAVTAAREPAAPTAAAVYEGLAVKAASGDRRAADLKRDVDRWLAARGLQPGDMAVPELVTSSLDAGLARLRIDDLSPWAIDVLPDPEIRSRADLQAYVALRHAAVEHLATKTPDREIDAALAPRLLLSVTDLASRTRCACRVSEVVVDVWGPDGWVMSSGRVFEGLSLRVAAAAIEAEILDQVGVSLDQYPGLRRADLRVTVRRVMVSLTAREASRLTAEPDLLAVDTSADIGDRFSGRAASINVAEPPDLFRINQEQLGVQVEPAYEPQKGVQP